MCLLKDIGRILVKCTPDQMGWPNELSVRLPFWEIGGFEPLVESNQCLDKINSGPDGMSEWAKGPSPTQAGGIIRIGQGLIKSVSR